MPKHRIMIFSDGLRIYSTLDQKAQSGMEQVMLNEDTGDGELFPALWHEEDGLLARLSRRTAGTMYRMTRQRPAA